jgi:uncharacterized membrane protein YsdA (DUF1294 family)
MWSVETIAAVYLAAMNGISFALFGLDKQSARKGRGRLPENRLHLFALLGGFLGGILGMQVFRHKTRKPSFIVVYVLASLLSGIAILYAWWEWL